MKTINEYFNNMVNVVARRRIFANLESIYFTIKDAMNECPENYPEEWNTLITKEEFMEFVNEAT